MDLQGRSTGEYVGGRGWEQNTAGKGRGRSRKKPPLRFRNRSAPHLSPGDPGPRCRRHGHRCRDGSAAGPQHGRVHGPTRKQAVHGSRTGWGSAEGWFSKALGGAGARAPGAGLPAGRGLRTAQGNGRRGALEGPLPRALGPRARGLPASRRARVPRVAARGQVPRGAGPGGAPSGPFPARRRAHARALPGPPRRPDVAPLSTR